MQLYTKKPVFTILLFIYKKVNAFVMYSNDTWSFVKYILYPFPKCLSKISVIQIPRPKYLGKSSCCHLHSALIRGVNLQVVAVRAVQAQEATSRKSSIVTWNIVHGADHTVKWTDPSIKTFLI